MLFRSIRFLEQLAGQLVSVVLEACADEPEREDVRSQIQRWQEDPFLAELIAIYQQDDIVNPIDSGWITLGQPRWEPQEVAV